MIVRFVNIGVIIDHHCLNFLFISCWLVVTVTYPNRIACILLLFYVTSVIYYFQVVHNRAAVVHKQTLNMNTEYEFFHILTYQ